MHNIENILYPQEPYINTYLSAINSGLSFIANKKIIFLGLCRDVADVIENNLSKISTIGNQFADYKIIIFENDSTDSTKDILNNLKNNNTNIEILSEDLNRQKYGSSQDKDRIVALAEYRNVLRLYAKNKYPDYDFVCVIDTDFIDFSINGFLNSFGYFSQDSDLSAMSGYSYRIMNCIYGDKQSLWNYDSWAYREYWWNNWQAQDKTEFANYDRMIWYGYCIPPVGLVPKQVNSSFGGCCIYKSSYYFSDVSYDSFDCEHVCFHYGLYSKNNGFKLFVNPSQIMLVK